MIAVTNWPYRAGANRVRSARSVRTDNDGKLMNYATPCADNPFSL